MRAVALTPGAFSAIAARSGFGLLTIEGWTRHFAATGRRLAVRLDGVDVTDRCREASDEAGYVEVVACDARGRATLSPGGSPFERRYGAVTITETEAAS